MWKYNGKGFIIGIPARDLSDEEAKRYMPRIKKCGLYVHIKDKPPKKQSYPMVDSFNDDLGIVPTQSTDDRKHNNK